MRRSRWLKGKNELLPANGCATIVSEAVMMNECIVIDPRIQHGKPVIRGTRLPVARIVGGLAGGMTIDEIVREYGVTDDDVRAALSSADEEVTYDSDS
jgi:uncharacterized protein (DUF433 family)